MIASLSDEQLGALISTLLDEQAKREPAPVDDGPIVIMQGVEYGPEPPPDLGKHINEEGGGL